MLFNVKVDVQNNVNYREVFLQCSNANRNAVA
jgi:hypothetical protein